MDCDSDESGCGLCSSIWEITNDVFVDKSKECSIGSNGIIYKGYQVKAHRIIAVKFISNKMLRASHNHKREIEVLKKLSMVSH
jgi:hypothetical protein